MPRLIDAEKLGLTDFEIAMCDGDYKEALKMLIEKIENAPTVDAEPKHAYVIVDEDGNMECSNCGSSFCFDSYCGHCGAKLMGEQKKEVEVVDSMPTMWVMDENSHRCLTYPKENKTSVKHGYWCFEEFPDGYYHWECSECEKWFAEDSMSIDEEWEYCPNCGAKMDELINLNEREKSHHDTERDD